jgi:ribulose-5-phosphate 4-epimerase/fuculose-1-phosphate aldolase
VPGQYAKRGVSRPAGGRRRRVGVSGRRTAQPGGGNIRAAVTSGPAVLLANHGVLVFHRTPDLAILIGSVVEEPAQAGINSSGLGGPVEIPAGMRAAALQRAVAFESRGTVST